MDKNDLITDFFYDKEDYLHFATNLKELVKANDDATCFAEISKVKEGYLYKLTWLKDGKFVGDYITPFEATEENIQKFNRGSRIIAERLNIYIKTNNPNLVPVEPPAFGNLTKFVG